MKNQIYHSFTLSNPNLKDISLNNTSPSTITNPNITQPIKSNYTTLSFKLVLIGDINVGKTSILSRYFTNSFDENIKCSVGVDYKVKNINFNKNLKIDLCIWDTCGQERFRNLTKQYYRDSHAILLIFSLSEIKSFNNLSFWLEELKNNMNDENCFIYLIGNKYDEKNIDSNVIQEFLNQNNFIKGYFEVSAKNGLNIDYAFNIISKELVDLYYEDKSFVKNKNYINRESNIISFKKENKKCC